MSISRIVTGVAVAVAGVIASLCATVAGGQAAPGGTLAQRPAPGPVSRDPATVPAGRYELDGTHSQVTGSVDHMGLSNTQVAFKAVGGSFTWDPARPEASTLSVAVDPASLDTGNAERDGRLRGAMFLNTASFAKASYVATGLKRLDAVTAVIDGDLTLHGVTKPVSLTVRFNGTGTGMMRDTRAGFSARGQFKRSDFGITAFAPMVGDVVSLSIDVEAVKR